MDLQKTCLAVSFWEADYDERAQNVKFRNHPGARSPKIIDSENSLFTQPYFVSELEFRLQVARWL